MSLLSRLYRIDFSGHSVESISTSKGVLNYWMVVCAVLAQIATVVITWQLWQVRMVPPNLPLLDFPEFSFGIWVILSLVLMLFDPRRGFIIHVVTMLVASMFDQFRLQPQFLAIIFLMFAAIDRRGLVVCRWFLAALWLWAGIHKLVSPHWFSHAGHWMLQAMSFGPESADRFLWPFAFLVGFAEVVTGVVAIFRARWRLIFVPECMFPFLSS